MGVERFLHLGLLGESFFVEKFGTEPLDFLSVLCALMHNSRRFLALPLKVIQPIPIPFLVQLDMLVLRHQTPSHSPWLSENTTQVWQVLGSLQPPVTDMKIFSVRADYPLTEKDLSATCRAV
eukprot:COSAG05_NODE_4782_length_1374_cov_161.020392_1_plen_122_part_00